MNEDAASKYENYKKIDPFPDIDVALLNSADIVDYVNATGMIDPFYIDKLKPASYEANIKGECIFWNEKGNKQVANLVNDHDTFKLEPNSIAFVEIEPTFRLPEYIALRFNLKITNVYRGLLLGTGPLIDPGYVGKIYIPLHNLTTNTYVFECGEGLIWIEFTKISKIRTANNTSGSGSISRTGKYEDFPPRKTNKPLTYFLNKANKGKIIASSIPEAKIIARKTEKKVNTFGIIGALGFIAALVGLIYPGWQLLDSYFEKLDVLRKENTIQDKVIEKNKMNHAGKLSDSMNSLIIMLEKQKNQTTLLQKEIASLKNEIKLIKNIKQKK